MSVYRLYADGSSGAKGGKPGGWGWILLHEVSGVLAFDSGAEESTTNNRQELTAIINGLSFVLQNRPAEMKRLLVISDSQYALNTIGGNWSPNTNADLIEKGQRALAAVEALGVCLELTWVKGHSGEEWNERVDWLATSAKEELKATLGYGKLYTGFGQAIKGLPLKERKRG